MTNSRIPRLRSVLDTPIGLALVALSLLTVALTSPWSAGAAEALPAGSAATGPVVLTPDEGDGSTTFTAIPNPVPAACPGTAADGHFWQTFMTPLTVDPGTLTYDFAGPQPKATEFTQPLYSAGTPVVNNNPATAPAGLIVGAPEFYDFSAFDTTFRPPAGDYWVGIACTLAGETTAFWATPITIVDGGSALFTWSASAAPPPSSSTTTSTTQASTTTAAPGSTTTVAGATTSTTTGSSTSTTSTSTTVAGTSTTRPTTTLARASSGAGSSSGGGSSPSGSLATTGSSPLRWLTWGALLVVVGRMVVLVGRRTKVLPGEWS